MSVGENIKRARLKKLMTQRELAEKLGITSNTLYRYEHGDISISLETLKQLADTLEVPLCSLIMEEGECPQIRKKLPEGSENKNIPPK